MHYCPYVSVDTMYPSPVFLLYLLPVILYHFSLYIYILLIYLKIFRFEIPCAYFYFSKYNSYVQLYHFNNNIQVRAGKLFPSLEIQKLRNLSVLKGKTYTLDGAALKKISNKQLIQYVYMILTQQMNIYKL